MEFTYEVGQTNMSAPHCQLYQVHVPWGCIPNSGQTNSLSLFEKLNLLGTILLCLFMAILTVRLPEALIMVIRSAILFVQRYACQPWKTTARLRGLRAEVMR